MTEPSPFAVLETTFRLLSAEPCPLAIDSRQLGHGSPGRQIPIVELRRIVTNPTACSDLHDRVIEAVLSRMTQQRATWMVVLGGLVLPGLRRRAKQLMAANDEPALDIEAELLWQFAAVLRRSKLDAHRYVLDLLQLAQSPDHAMVRLATAASR